MAEVAASTILKRKHRLESASHPQFEGFRYSFFSESLTIGPSLIILLHVYQLPSIYRKHTARLFVFQLPASRFKK